MGQCAKGHNVSSYHEKSKPILEFFRILFLFFFVKEEVEKMFIHA